jgi:biopolymer transport protein ExbD
MRLSKRHRKTRMEMDMTPMIDVAFQLIIFFMTVSQMTQANQERLQLPKQKGAEVHKPLTIVINVTAKGELRMNGKTVAMAEFISQVGNELQQLGDDPSKLHVVIRADEESKSRGVNDIVTALAKLRITRIRIAVDSGG